MKDQPIDMAEKLKNAGVRCTRQRVEICHHLFDEGDRHVTAETLWQEVKAAGSSVSLATIYNTLNELQSAGLLISSRVDSERTIFDTNTGAHHHAVDLRTGEIFDLPLDAIVLKEGVLPPSAEVESLQLIVRLRTPGQGAS